MKLLALGVVVHDITDQALLVSCTGRREDARTVPAAHATFVPHQSREKNLRDRPVEIVTRSQGVLHIEENIAERLGLLGQDAWSWGKIPVRNAA